MGVPDGWNDYDRVGKPVDGTRFIAFKVPIKESSNRSSQVPEEKQLYPKLLVSLVPKLGLIIDLTNTYKYYNPDEFTNLGVRYQKIMVQGQQIPNTECSVQFRNAVNDFLEENGNNDKLIGVHCTHGLNRSGFLICRYMIEEMSIPASDAIAAFENARGHKMERENYLAKLKNLRKIPKLASLAIDTENEKGTQTNHGYFISDNLLPPLHRTSYAPLDASDQSRKQVQFFGYVETKRNDLIPDGRGGYFVHIMKRDIQQHDPNPQRHETNRRGSRWNQYKRPSHTSTPISNCHSHSQPNNYVPRARYPHNQMFMGNSMPMGSNNIVEDLLRMPYNPNMNVNMRGGRHARPH